MFEWFLIGIIVGIVVDDYLWKGKIEEKAAYGFRLECRGKLYRVTPDAD